MDLGEYTKRIFDTIKNYQLENTARVKISDEILALIPKVFDETVKELSEAAEASTSENAVEEKESVTEEASVSEE